MTAEPATSALAPPASAAGLSPLVRGREGLLGQGAAVFLVSVAGAAVSLLVQVTLARALGPQEFGGYSVLLAWAMVLVLLGKLGLDPAMLRFAAAYSAQGQLARLRGLVERGLSIGLVMGLLAGAALALAGPSLIGPGSPGARAALSAGALIPLLAVLQLQKSVLLGLRKPISGMLPEQLVRHSLLLVLVLLAPPLFSFRLDAARALFLVFLAALLALLVAHRTFLRSLPPALRSVRAEYRTREWLSTSLPLLVVSLAQVGLARADLLVLAVLRSGREAGIYAAAAACASSLEFFISAANTVVGPAFARHQVRGQRAALQDLLTRTVQVLLLTTLPLAGLLLLFGDRVLLLFGPDYAQGRLPLSLLVLGQLLLVFTGSVGLLLSMTGAQRAFARVMVLTAGLNLSLDFLLIPPLGMNGAAAATLISVALRCTLLGFTVWQTLGAMPTPFAPLLLSLRRRGGGRAP